MVKRMLILALAALAIVLLTSAVALAATPQDIHDDFADNGFLDGTYTYDELNAFLQSSLAAEYADRVTLPEVIEEVEENIDRDTFPFTGFQLLVAGIVAVALVGGGFALRRMSRSGQS